MQENEPPDEVDFKGNAEVENVLVKRDEPMDRDKDEIYCIHVCAGHLSFAKI
jgi:hypothetical protein